MMKFLRSQSQTVLTVVLAVIGLGFLFYGSSGNLLTPNSRVSTDYGRIDGSDLTQGELVTAVRTTRHAMMLGPDARELYQAGAGTQVAERAWSQLLLLHEADKLHILTDPSTDAGKKELIDYIKKQPIFQKNGTFDPETYRSRLGQIASILRIQPNGATDPMAATSDAVQAIMLNNLRVDAVSQALFSTVRSSAHEVSAQYDKYSGPVELSVITFDPKQFIAAAQVTPDDIAKEYKDHPMNPAYRTKELRKVDYVLFQLTPDQAKLPEKEKQTAMEGLGQKALDFALAFQPEPSATPSATPPPAPDFIAEAKKRNLDPKTTDFFASDATPAGVPPSPAFNSAATGLSKDNAISKVVEMDNGVAVLHLVEIKPSDLLPLDQVKGAIADELKKTKGQEAMQAAAANAAQNLKANSGNGIDFKITAALMGLKAESVPAFVPMKASQTDPRLQTLAYASISLEPGAVSDPIPLQTDESVVIIHLDKRSPADPAGLANFEKRFRESQDDRLRSAVINDWVAWRSRQPGTHKPQELDSYGSVE